MEAIIVRRRKSKQQIEKIIVIVKNLIELLGYGSNLCVGWHPRVTVWAPDVDRVRADTQYVALVLDLAGYVRDIFVYNANEFVDPNEARSALKNIQEADKIMIRVIR